MDLEWFRDDDPNLKKRGNFRCGTWMSHDDEKLKGTFNLHTIARVVRDCDTIVGHGITADIKKLVQWGVPLPKQFKIVDTLLLARILHPLWPKKDLKYVGRIYGYPLVDLHDVKNPDRLLDYCGKDTYTTHKLWEIFSEEAKEQKRIQPRVIGRNFQFALDFMSVELAGMKLDRTFLMKEQQRLTKELASHVKRLQDPKVITNNNVLLEKLQDTYPEATLDKFLYNKRKDTYAVKNELLVMLPDKPQWLETALLAREQQKYKTLYVDNVLEYGEYINPNFFLLHAKTHRRTTSPTIQNWPSEARRAVVSRFPNGRIIEGDMKNLEARITGIQAKCKQFVDDMITQGYLGVAARTLGVEKLTDKKDPRYVEIKSTVLAVTYHMGAGLFAYREWVQSQGKKRKRSYKDVEEKTYGTFFAAYPEIEKEIERRSKYGLKHGYTDTWCGAHVQLPMFNERWIENSNLSVQIGMLYSKLKNFSINWPTQLFASYVTGCALTDLIHKLVDYYFEGDYGSYLHYCHASRGIGNSTSVIRDLYPVVIGEVHDSLIIDCPFSEVKRVTQMMHDAMCDAVTLSTIAPDFLSKYLDVEIVADTYWKKG